MADAKVEKLARVEHGRVRYWGVTLTYWRNAGVIGSILGVLAVCSEHWRDTGSTDEVHAIYWEYWQYTGSTGEVLGVLTCYLTLR